MDSLVAERRQPLAARVWGRSYRTWWPPDGTRHRKRAKRRSGHRERQQTRARLRDCERGDDD